MNDASTARSGPTTTCPDCGSVQPPARRCKDCGAALPWSRPKPVLKGRERALAATRRGRSGARRTAWAAGSVVLLLAGALVAVYWGHSPTSGSSTSPTAALEARPDRTDSRPPGAVDTTVDTTVGVARLPTRTCVGTGEDAKCIEQFDDPGPASARTSGTGTAAALLRDAETVRRKAQESAEILKGL